MPLILAFANWLVELAWRPFWNQTVEEVAAVMAPKLLVKVNGSEPAPVASVPQERTPVVLDFTSQLALLRPETMRAVVEAVPETVIAVVEAYGKVEAVEVVAVK